MAPLIKAASMGPRSCERGNQPRCARVPVCRRLQWGRARASAEIDLVADLRHHAGTRLQWGRARASAEIRRHALGVLAPFRLQWGRARASAEIRWAANVALWPL